MEFKIAIYGSAVNDHRLDERRVKELIDKLSEHKIAIITGACSGVPYQIASRLAEKKIKVYGYSAEFNLKGQKQMTPSDDLSIYAKIIYTPKRFEEISMPEARKKYRNVVSTNNCDAGIIIAGRWGTLNEFTNLYDMSKVIGVLTKTGGIADELPRLCQIISKKSQAKVFFSPSPAVLVKKVMAEVKRRKKS